MTKFFCLLSAAAILFALSSAHLGNGHPIEKCSWREIDLFGRVQIVERFPDIKVQVVTAFPALKVQQVEAFPNSCGKWQFVDEFPDFKVQFVSSFPDLKIQFVESFPGIP